MKPTKEEIESYIGGKIPDDKELEFGENEPIPDAQTSFNLLAIVKDKYKIFRKTRLGKFVGIYIALVSLGFPIPTPYQIVTTTTKEMFDATAYVYNYLDLPTPHEIRGFLAATPENLPHPSEDPNARWAQLPPGSGIYPV